MTNDSCKFGHIAVNLGYCTNEHVTSALADKEDNERIGETLLRKGYITKHQIDWTLEYQNLHKNTEPPQNTNYESLAKQRSNLVHNIRQFTQDIYDINDRLRASIANGYPPQHQPDQL